MKHILRGLQPYFPTESPCLSIVMFHLRIRACILASSSSLQFSLQRLCRNACLSNCLSCAWRDNCLKALKMVSMENAAMLPTWIKWLFPVSWCLFVVKNCHAEGRHYCLASWVALVGFLLCGSLWSQCMPQSLLLLFLPRNQPERTEFYEAGIWALIRQRNMAIERNADYVEK